MSDETPDLPSLEQIVADVAAQNGDQAAATPAPSSPAAPEKRPVVLGQAQPPAPAEAAPPAPEPPPQPVAQPDPRVEMAYQKVVERERELQRMRDELAQERQQLEPLRRYQELHRRLNEKDAFGALEEMGVDTDELARAIVEGRGVRPTAGLEEKFDKRLQEVEQKFKQETERLQKITQARLVEEARSEVRSELSKRSPILEALGDTSVNAVLDKFQEHYNRTGRTPTYDEVIGEVEAEVKGFFTQASKAEAIRQLLLAETGQSPSEPQAAPQQAAPVTPQTKTLSNQAAAQVTTINPDIELPDNRMAAIDAILSRG